MLYALLARPEVEQIVLLNRSAARAEALADSLGGAGRVVVAGLDRDGCAAATGAGLLINATSVGMHPVPDASPLADPGCLGPGMLVLDIVYNPRRTRLMMQAEAAGARSVNGLGMLACQGARAFEIWTGHWPPVDAMLAGALAGFAAAGH